MENSTLNSMLEELRGLADERHKVVIQAIERISAYLGSRDLDREMVEALSERFIRTSARAALRERVLAALEKDGLNVAEVAAKTGLTEKQVRGVLYSKQVEGRVIRTKTYGETRFLAKTSAGGRLS